MILSGVKTYEELASEFTREERDETLTYYGDEVLREGFPTRDELIACFMSEPGYEMSCILYYRRGGELFEAEFCHCSCYGFGEETSGSFPKQPISVEYLRMRPAPDWVRESAEASVRWDEFLENVS